ncbi:MAG: hypothetical protein GX577_05740, partial [Leptolinea sp.]|nr:hypothetical protein [Leptolinea sp.]
KEKIPIESVFAYIEAKHTLEINGGSNNSLKKALLQISKVKELVLQRTPVGRNQLSEFVVLGKGFTISEKPGWPSIQNPPYGMLLARQVRINTKSQLMTSPDDIHNALVGSPVESNILPDLIVAGPSNFILPVNQLENKQEISSPFFLFENNNNIYHPKSILSTNKVDGIAFGIALAHLFWALDHINLGVMPWEKILGNGMQVEKS